MATKLSQPTPAPRVDPVAKQINQSIDRLVLFLEQRRVELLTELRNIRDEVRANRVAREQMEQQVAETRAVLEGQLIHNKLHSMQERIVTELEAKLAELQVAPPPQEVRFLCDTRDLEEHIACLGEIVRLEIPPIPPMPEIPNYAAFQQPTVAVGKKGSSPGEFKSPRGVAIEAESEHIYVVDMDNKRIQIFSQTGEHLNQFGHQHLIEPYGILIHQDSIYVTDTHHHSIFLFTLPELTMMKRVGKRGTEDEEFDYLRQLAISPNQQLYVTDLSNNRLHILSTDLAFQGTLRHDSTCRR